MNMNNLMKQAQQMQAKLENSSFSASLSIKSVLTLMMWQLLRS